MATNKLESPAGSSQPPCPKLRKKLNIFSNRKGEEVLSLYWFMILLIVAGGIVGMVLIFYGNPYNVGDVEANLLVDRIADCISYGGKINESLISCSELKDFDFSQCHLNFEGEEEEFFYKVEIYKLEDLENSCFEKNGGNLNLEASYAINKYSEKLPTGAEKSFYSLDNLKNQYIIKILTVVRKTKQNV